MRIFGHINLILDWDKNFSIVSIAPNQLMPKISDKKNYQALISKNQDGWFSSSIEHMALIPKSILRRIIAKSEQPMYFYLYSYLSEKDQYSLILAGEDRFILFLHLLKVQQIGPKLACLIASEFCSLSEFYNVISKNDYKTLAKIPGLGTKKASLIVWHFNRQGAQAFLNMEAMKQGDTPYEAIFMQLIQTLHNLGISKTKAKQLVHKKKQELIKAIMKQRQESDSTNINKHSVGMINLDSTEIGELVKILLRSA